MVARTKIDYDPKIERVYINTDQYFAPVPLEVRQRAVIKAAPTLGDVVGAFKSLTTNRYIRGVRQRDWPRFDRRLWQRNYYEHIIRHTRALHAIRSYIVNNPLNWHLDRYNPDHAGTDPCMREL